ncbi:class 1 fructose-bisphosphatase [Aeoliella sp. ICT_H6.2]|uniref:Fructose-1,6-bisphosphatase class 1 n=1 Tax=Aeoliella straminimaris TaxID=2954799 RepID=A0A9X2FBF4_9BACT|nr:class 1 fructose-bisphosphatase [Aeoliella straminimaris]MCO6045153.1 class 1 fructose-bisphosphatase [Aeoliella straminimaris]
MPIKRDGEYVTFGQHLQEQQQRFPSASGQFSWLMSGITLATKMIASYVRRAGLIDVWGDEGSVNVQGEDVKKLDIIANEALKRTLGYRGNVGIIASEEDNDPRVLQDVDPEDSYIIMFDPLDGSSNIDVNVSVGTIFTIFRNPPEVIGVEKSVLQKGVEQVAGGYVLYGSSTVLVYTCGNGVHQFTLDPQFGAYLLTRENIKMPEYSRTYSVNEAYLHRFPESYQKYLEWSKDPEGGGFSSRYVGSLVADFHRILIKGGIFLYPPTEAHPGGKLRLMYECNPLAFIAEQAGGMAICGEGQRIVEIQPKAIHDRTSLVIGSRKNVEEMATFLK